MKKFDAYDPEVSMRQDPDKLARLLQEVEKAKQAGQISFTEDGIMLIGGATKMQLGGVFHSSVMRHELVQRAIDDGDPDKEAWVRHWVRDSGALALKKDFFKTMASAEHNLLPNAGLDFALNVLLYTTNKISTWYYGPFISNWTPVATALSNWAGATSGPLATELANAQFDESNRQAAVFASASSSQTLASSSSTTITIATGESGITMYGTTLNESSTVAYNVTDKILLAGTTFANSKSGLGATDIIHLDYELSASSS